MSTYSRDTYRQIASLHATCINEGFLSSLGVGFLSLLYESIDAERSSVLFVEESDDRVVGFVAGAIGMGPIYKQLLRRWPRLLAALTSALLSPTKLWRIVELLALSTSHTPIPGMPRAELLSIAVDPSSRRKGHAERLYRRLIQHFADNGVDSFRIVVGEALHSAQRFYTRMGAQIIGEIEVHSGQTSRVYKHSCLKGLRRPNSAFPAS